MTRGHPVWAPALVGVGSSSGDRWRALRLAVQMLSASRGVRVMRVSRAYRTPPMGGVARGWFLNAVLLLQTRLGPFHLLRLCQQMEWRLGRLPGVARWGDRRIDIDLLQVGGAIMDSPSLTLPHPGIASRSFVLRPLVEVAPALRDPRSGRRWSSLPVPGGAEAVAVGVLAPREYSRYEPRLHSPSVSPLHGRRTSMKFFIDTANLDEIREASSWGIIDGCTTNPSLIAREGGDFVQTIHDICQIVQGPVSAEVVAQDADGMVKEGRLLARISEHVVIKVPLTREGLKATRRLSNEGIRVNVTLCFQPVQALLAAKAGAAYISPFVGRLDDISTDGMGLISQIVEIFSNYPELQTEVLVASVRHPGHVVEAAQMGADVATIPFKVLQKLFSHPLTDKGNAAFLRDWSTVPDADIVGQVTRWLAARGD